MARKKKKILFDVMGSGGSARRSSALFAAARRGQDRGKKGGLADGEVRMSTPLVLALGVAIVVSMGLTYYFGVRQGSGGVTPPGTGESAALRRDVAEAPSRVSFAILATSKHYSRFTKEDQVEELKALGGALVRAGFPEVSLQDYPDKDLLKLWVGAGATKEELEPVAAQLRAFRNERGEMPCKNAWTRDLRDNP